MCCREAWNISEQTAVGTQRLHYVSCQYRADLQHCAGIEIGDLHPVVRHHQEVVWLDVSVDDSLGREELTHKHSRGGQNTAGSSTAQENEQGLKRAVFRTATVPNHRPALPPARLQHAYFTAWTLTPGRRSRQCSHEQSRAPAHRLVQVLQPLSCVSDALPGPLLSDATAGSCASEQRAPLRKLQNCSDTEEQ